MSVRGIALAVVCLLSFTLDAGCNEASAETTKVHYGSRSTEVLTVFPQAGADHPIVVLVHGGTWREQSKETMLQTTAEAIQKRLSATVVDVNYPQYPELEPSVAFPVEPEAVQRATEWALANGAAYGGSAARLALVGLSAGGNLAALVTQLDELEGIDRTRERVNALREIVGRTPEEARAFLAKADELEQRAGVVGGGAKT